MEGLKIWYDPEGDYLEVNFARKPGILQATPVPNMLVKVDEDGQIIGFAVLNISEAAEAPLEIDIPFGRERQVLKAPAANG
jgi:uncharacterized protein YuzE